MVVVMQGKLPLVCAAARMVRRFGEDIPAVVFNVDTLRHIVLRVKARRIVDNDVLTVAAGRLRWCVGDGADGLLKLAPSRIAIMARVYVDCGDAGDFAGAYADVRVG